jgi:hypothetical protein
MKTLVENAEQPTTPELCPPLVVPASAGQPSPQPIASIPSAAPQPAVPNAQTPERQVPMLSKPSSFVPLVNFCSNSSPQWAQIAEWLQTHSLAGTQQLIYSNFRRHMSFEELERFRNTHRSCTFVENSIYLETPLQRVLDYSAAHPQNGPACQAAALELIQKRVFELALAISTPSPDPKDERSLKLMVGLLTQAQNSASRARALDLRERSVTLHEAKLSSGPKNLQPPHNLNLDLTPNRNLNPLLLPAPAAQPSPTPAAPIPSAPPESQTQNPQPPQLEIPPCPVSIPSPSVHSTATNSSPHSRLRLRHPHPRSLSSPRPHRLRASPQLRTT